MSAGIAAQRARIERYFSEQAGAVGQVVDARRVRVATGGSMLTFDAQVADGEGGKSTLAAALDLSSGELHLAEAGGASGCVSQSSSGSLAWVAMDAELPGIALGGIDHGALRADRTILLPAGVVEDLAWSPDGSKLLVLLASPGASLSDAFGSGRIEATSREESWRPTVNEQIDEGRRILHIVDPDSGSVSALAAHQNAWEACWLGDDAVLALVSAGADETAWYDAQLTELRLSGEERIVPTPGAQLAHPAASPSGGWMSVIAGPMSDRGIDAGSLLVRGRNDVEWREISVPGGDTTDHVWVNEGTIVSAAMRGLLTEIIETDVQTLRSTVRWSATATCGDDLIPRVAASGGTIAFIRSSYLEPPQLCVARGDEIEVALDLAVPNAESVSSRAGRIEAAEWVSGDGTSIQGFLVSPKGEGPFPLIVDVHGGPVYAFRNYWLSGETQAPLFAEAGYAVLMPNIRGSFGRGERFIAEGLFDMCGERDVDDLLSGIRYLVERGVADPKRVVITGNSYGGLMSAWLAVEHETFVAAIPTSPVTDWVSQHFTSNLTGFDQLALSGDPLDPSSPYRTRSPLYRASLVRIPVLLMAGEKDLATPPEQAVMFHRAVLEHGGHSELVLYPEEGHGVHDPNALVDKFARIFDFLERVLPRD